jgi:hypothetical protein
MKTKFTVDVHSLDKIPKLARRTIELEFIDIVNKYFSLAKVISSYSRDSNET